MLQARRQADAGQGFLDALLALGGSESAIAQRHVNVVEKVEVRNQVEALEDESDLFVAQFRSGIVIQAAHVDTVQPVLATGELLKQTGDVEKGRLAGTGWSGHRDEFTLPHVDREITQGVGLDEMGAVDLLQVGHLQHVGILRGIESLRVLMGVALLLPGIGNGEWMENRESRIGNREWVRGQSSKLADFCCCRFPIPYSPFPIPRTNPAPLSARL